jgi:hypothetical protein
MFFEQITLITDNDQQALEEIVKYAKEHLKNPWDKNQLITEFARFLHNHFAKILGVTDFSSRSSFARTLKHEILCEAVEKTPWHEVAKHYLAKAKES